MEQHRTLDGRTALGDAGVKAINKAITSLMGAATAALRAQTPGRVQGLAVADIGCARELTQRALQELDSASQIERDGGVVEAATMGSRVLEEATHATV